MLHDGIIISGDFMKFIIGKILSRYINGKLKTNLDIKIKDIDVVVDEGNDKVTGHLEVTFSGSTHSVKELVGRFV